MGHQLSKLDLRGFKSISVLENLSFRELNVLIGANGSGKSNFISFFSLLRSIVDEDLQSYVTKHGGASTFLYRGPEVTQTIEAQLEFGTNGYELVLEYASNDTLFFKEERIRFAGDFRPVDRSIGRGHRESELATHAREGAQKEVAKFVRKSLSDWLVYHFHDTSFTSAVRRNSLVLDNEELHPNASNLASFLLWMKKNEEGHYDLILDTLRLVAPFFKNFNLRAVDSTKGEVVSLEWKEKGSPALLGPLQLSDGTLRFLCLITALLQPRPPSTIILDEPEIGLHPYALQVLAAICQQTAEAGVQVILTTQSPALLDQFDARDVITVDRHEGSSRYQRLDADALHEWLKDYTLSELWIKNVYGGSPTNG